MSDVVSLLDHAAEVGSPKLRDLWLQMMLDAEDRLREMWEAEEAGLNLDA